VVDLKITTIGSGGSGDDGDKGPSEPWKMIGDGEGWWIKLWQPRVEDLAMMEERGCWGHGR
jgi:hypothetical protein